jgi:hypothetical protein
VLRTQTNTKSAKYGYEIVIQGEVEASWMDWSIELSCSVLNLLENTRKNQLS